MGQCAVVHVLVDSIRLQRERQNQPVGRLTGFWDVWPIFTARRAMLCIRGTSHGLCPCMSVSVTSRCSIETAERTELVFGMWASFYPFLHCVTRSSAIAEGPRDASCQLKFANCHTTVQKLLVRPKQIEVLKLKRYSKAMCIKHVHSTMTRSVAFVVL